MTGDKKNKGKVRRALKRPIIIIRFVAPVPGGKGTEISEKKKWKVKESRILIVQHRKNKPPRGAFTTRAGQVWGGGARD